MATLILGVACDGRSSYQLSSTKVETYYHLFGSDSISLHEPESDLRTKYGSFECFEYDLYCQFSDTLRINGYEAPVKVKATIYDEKLESLWFDLPVNGNQHIIAEIMNALNFNEVDGWYVFKSGGAIVKYRISKVLNHGYPVRELRFQYVAESSNL